MKQKNTKR